MNAEQPINLELSLQLQAASMDHLLAGRGERDITHSKTVAQYARLLGEAAIDEGHDVDVLVLTTAGYLHDVGYDGLLPINYTLADVKAVKAAHMEQSMKLSREILHQPHIRRHYTSEQILKILQIVSTHDNYDQVSSLEEQLFMEADTLGALDVDRAGSQLNITDTERYLAGIEFGRSQYFKSELGLLLLDVLKEKLSDQVASQRMKNNHLCQSEVIFEPV